MFIHQENLSSIVAVATIFGMMDWIARPVRVEIAELLWRLCVLRNMRAITVPFRRMPAHGRRVHESRGEMIDRSFGYVHRRIRMHGWKTS